MKQHGREDEHDHRLTIVTERCLCNCCAVKRLEKKYPIYFGDIQSLDYRLYKTRMARGTDEAFNDEIVLESWHNSGVCQKKMVRYRRGVILSCIAIGFALLSLGAHFFMYRV